MNKAKLTTALVAAGIILFSQAHAANLVGVVNYITDGDTFEMQVNGETVKIRVCGIEAPESSEPNFARSRDYLFGHIMKRTVRCVPVGQGSVCDGRSPPRNRDRIVAQCFLDKQDVGELMIRAGMACDWLRFSGGHYSKIIGNSVCTKH